MNGDERWRREGCGGMEERGVRRDGEERGAAGCLDGDAAFNTRHAQCGVLVMPNVP